LIGVRFRGLYAALALALALLAAGAACASRVHWRPLSEAEVATLRGQEPRLTLERNGCTRDCPEYRIVVYGDGTVDYEGFNNVKKPGRQSWKIPPERVAQLSARLEKAGYYDWDNRCCGYVPDGPCDYTTLTNAGKSNRVLCCPGGGGPEELTMLGDEIDSVTDAGGLIGSDAGAFVVYQGGSAHCGTPRGETSP
jgi:hypothetical protein